MARAQTGTRSGILDLLKLEGESSAAELASRLGVTAVAARQHLSVLEAEGLVESSLRRVGVGRPSAVYRLTEKGYETFPRLYDEFLITVLEAIKDTEGKEGLHRVLDWRTSQAERTHGRRIKEMEPRQRVQAMFRMYADSGHMPEIEEEPGAVVITEHNCPIARVSRRFPEICRSELEMVRLITGLPVTRDKCLAEGGGVCRYRFPMPEAGDGRQAGGSPGRGREEPGSPGPERSDEPH